MDYDDNETVELAKLATYADFLDKFVTPEDRQYLEDEELARDVKELYAVDKGEIRCKEDFLRKKKELMDLMHKEDPKERDPFSSNKEYEPDTLLDELKKREQDVRNGRKSTIIFIRYKESKTKETSAYIDFRERLKNEEMALFFEEKRDLIPRPSDLSYYNWSSQNVKSNDSTFFRVDAGFKERLSFKNNTDRKIINVDLEYRTNHPHNDVNRLILDISKQKSVNPNLKVTKIDPKKENKKRLQRGKKYLEEEEEDNLGYQQIVIFDYETRSK
ncbi:MAG: DUF4464 domain-containing protein [archaeon]|nr:DUF4464 domain-containing protein [archaeon]